MTGPRELSRESTDRLAVALNGEPPPPATESPRWRRVVRRLVRGVARPLDRVIQARADAAVAPLRAQLAEVNELRSELRAVPLNVELLKAESVAAHAVATNLELLKDEFRQLLATVEELGHALAPGAGLIGASTRIAELREQVNALERRLRHGAPASPGDSPRPDRGESPAEHDGAQSTLFDYVGFERRFRGDPEVVLAIQRERYEKTLLEHQPVLDVGCGRGELLEALAAAGIETIGVDTDPGMVAEAAARGLTVYNEDAVSYLRRQPEGSLGAIVAMHVAEHLGLDALIELLELSVTRLKPGGLLIAETPNPTSLIVLGNSYILDPTHVRPLHPSLFSFLCEGAGFRDIRFEFYAPAEAYHLPKITDASPATEQLNKAFAHLNHVLFGPQEYAIFATTPTTS